MILNLKFAAVNNLITVIIKSYAHNFDVKIKKVLNVSFSYLKTLEAFRKLKEGMRGPFTGHVFVIKVLRFVDIKKNLLQKSVY